MLALLVVVDAAEDRLHRQAGEAAELLRVVEDLRHQLARRRDHQGARRRLAARRGLVAQEAGEDA